MMFDADARDGSRGEAARARKPSTPYQRTYVRRLMQKLSLDGFQITLQHRRHFVLAGLGEQRLGARVDDVLLELTSDQISKLIHEYEREIPPRCR